MTRIFIPLATIFLSPLLLWQGMQTRKNTPRLPGAEGDSFGIISGDEKPINLLVIGESTVAGVGASSHSEGLTGQVAQALAAQSQCRVDWHAVGQNGFTARKVLDELLAQIPKQKFDVAVIVLGVNDTLKLTPARRWANDLTELVTALRERVNAEQIFLAGVPPMQHFPALPQPLRFMLGAKSQSLDTSAARLALQLQNVWHVPLAFHGGDEYFCADRFHPSPLGYKIWGETLGAAIAARISSAQK